MSRAVSKARKALDTRIALSALIRVGGAEGGAARKAHKLLGNVWNKRHGNNPGNFHAPNGRPVMHAKSKA